MNLLSPNKCGATSTVKSAAATPSATAHRPSSTVTRSIQDGRTVYVKQYLPGDWGRTDDVVQARTAREQKLLQQLHQSQLFGRRLGVVQIVTADPDRCTLVIEEVPGTTLDECTRSSFRGRRYRENTTVMFLAGKWLRRFQSLSFDEDDQTQISPYEQDDLVEYCTFRMQTLRESGSSWPSADMQRKIARHLERLLARSSTEDKRLVWGHGDYAPGNMIWDGHVLTPIDFGMAHLDRPLVDVTYLIHRLEMLRVYRPWKRWPIGVWKAAFLRGYGRPDAEQSPMYQACMMKHMICRVLTYVRRTPRDFKQALHDRWVRWYVRKKLERAIRD